MTVAILTLLLHFALVVNAAAGDLPPLKTTISDFAGMFPPASLDDLEHRLPVRHGDLYPCRDIDRQNPRWRQDRSAGRGKPSTVAVER